MTKKGIYIKTSCELSKQKQLVFGLLAAERFINCYKIFNKKEDFGNIIYMLESLRVIENAALTDKIDSELIEKYIKQVEENTPDTDDFGSIGGSLALNVGAIIYETLNIIEHLESRRLLDISTLCTDSIDFIILEIEDYEQMDFEKIASHNLMREEVQLQLGIIKYLEKIPSVDAGDIEALRLMQKEREFDKLSLKEILYS